MNFYKTIKEDAISGAKVVLSLFIVLVIGILLDYVMPQGDSHLLSKSAVSEKQSDSPSENQKRFVLPVLAQETNYALITLYTTKCSWVIGSGQSLGIDSDQYPNGNPNPVNFWRNTCQDEMGNEYPAGDPRKYPPVCNAGDTEIVVSSNPVTNSFVSCYPEDVALNVNIGQRILPSGGVGWYRYFSVAYTGSCERQCLHKPDYWF